jgi:hypothetical protein
MIRPIGRMIYYRNPGYRSRIGTTSDEPASA